MLPYWLVITHRWACLTTSLRIRFLDTYLFLIYANQHAPLIILASVKERQKPQCKNRRPITLFVSGCCYFERFSHKTRHGNPSLIYNERHKQHGCENSHTNLRDFNWLSKKKVLNLVSFFIFLLCSLIPPDRFDFDEIFTLCRSPF